MADASDNHATNRRGFLRRIGIVGAGVIGGAAAGAATATAAGSSDGMRREQLVFDIACVGETQLVIKPDWNMDDADSRRNVMVEGLIYPAGTIPGDGFVPTREGAIGEWFCRGWGIVRGGRGEPHLLTTHDYILGPITEGTQFPPDTLSSTGLEGSPDDTQPGVRAIVGGTGKYLGATGELVQANNGSNTTVLVGPQIPAPNWIFELDLRLPE